MSLPSTNPAAAAIGTVDWVRETRGNLTPRTRFELLRQVLAPSFYGLARTRFRIGGRRRVSIDDVRVPDSPAVEHALDEVRSCASDAVLQHSIRTYYWGAGLGRAEGRCFDPEELLVSCLLHDLGMTVRHAGRTACDCFAGDSAFAAAATMSAFGWDATRTERLADRIALHMNGDVPLSAGVEAQLLQWGAAFDLVGSRYYDLHASYRDAVLGAHPRHGVSRAFAAFIEAERARRPASRAALMHRLGLPWMIRLSPFAE